jgi:hypothetical protein
MATIDQADIRGSEPHNHDPSGAASDYSRESRWQDVRAPLEQPGEREFHGRPDPMREGDAEITSVPPFRGYLGPSSFREVNTATQPRDRS